MLRNIINEKVIEYTESLFGIMYLYFVLKNLLWFIKPLQDREEYALLWVWFEDKVELYEEKCTWLVEKVFPWRRRQREEQEKRHSNSASKWGVAGKKVKSMLTVKNKNSGERQTTDGSESQKPKRPSIGFSIPLHKRE